MAVPGLKPHTVHIVSHTHWDREWYLTFQQFRLKLVHLVDGLLELLDSDPGFRHFMLDGQTIVLEDYLRMRPDREARLRRYIQDGRLLIGPWYILPDMFLVGPEAHIRNLLQGARTAGRFGPKMMIGYVPDAFGHPGQLPQILRGFDMETACVWRGVDPTRSEFWWQSPDGSRLLMAYLRDGYSNGADLPADAPQRFAQQIDERAGSLARDAATSQLLIMYGTDHMEPPPGTARAIAFADQNLQATQVLHSTLPGYVSALREELARRQIELPIVQGELRGCQRMHLLPGVLSTRIWIKQRNQACESLLEQWVEPFSVFAEGVGRMPRQDRAPDQVQDQAPLIRETWRMLMENHPHDSICGCSIDQVHQEMKARFDQVEQIGEELTRENLETIAAAVDTQAVGGQAALVVFNPSNTRRRDLFQARLILPTGVMEFDLVDQSGQEVAYQQQGLGSRELVHMLLDANGLKSTFANIQDGRAAGMTIQEMHLRREGAEVFIEAVMAEGGQPVLAAWKAGIKQVEAFLTDPTITTYHVQARSPADVRLTAAADVPALGYCSLVVHPRPAAPRPPLRLNPLVRLLLPLSRLALIQELLRHRRVSRPPYRIENEFFQVEAQRDGSLTIRDRRSGDLYPGLNRFQDGGDCGDEYNYAPPSKDQRREARLKRVFIRRGPVEQTMELELELELPVQLTEDRHSRSTEMVRLPLWTTARLGRGIGRLEIHTRVDNLARDHRLRVHFPAPFSAQVGQHDGAFEIVERPLGVPPFDASWVEQPRPEVPQRGFTSVTDGRLHLTIANRGLPEVEVLQNLSGHAEIALTLLRCVGWLSRDDFSTRQGHAGPFLETPGAQLPGIHEFDYAIIPGKGAVPAFSEAYAFQAPLRVVAGSAHPGPLPPSASLLTTSPEEFVLSAIKAAEDGRGWLVRGYNLSGQRQEVTLLPWKPFPTVEQVNLAERRITALKPDPDGKVRLSAGPHEVLSVLFSES
jgi:alpha-mannosidase